MKNILRIKLVLVVFLIGGKPCTAQYDSLYTLLTFEYDISHGISQKHRKCTKQETFNSKEALVRSIQFSSDNTGNTQLSTIKYYYYDANNELLAIETLGMDERLAGFIHFKYSNLNRVDKFSAGSINDGNLMSMTSHFYTYQQNNISKIKSVNIKNKKVSMSNYSYTDSSIVVNTKLYKKHPLADSISNILETITLTQSKDTASIHKLYTYRNSKTVSCKKQYSYNSKNQLTKLELYRENQLVSTTQKEYISGGNIKYIVRVLAPGGKLLNYKIVEKSTTTRLFNIPKPQYQKYLSD